MKTINLWVKAIILLSLLTALSFTPTFAQEQFQLSDYINPDYQWRKLELGIGLAGQNTFSNQETDNGSNLNYRYNRFQFNSDADLNYYSTKNSKFYQGYQNFRLAGDMYGMRMKNQDIELDEENESKFNNQDIMLVAATVNRFYNNKKQFIEADLFLTSDFHHMVERNHADPEFLPFLKENNRHNYQFSGYLPVKVGLGRIEAVQDARLAVYILDDLFNSGDLTRVPTNEEIMTFSRFITETKNQRFFDGRIQKIAEITSIDSMLTVMGLKANSGASYFTLLNDNWDYADGPVRSAGGRFSVGLAPELEYDFYELESDFKDTLNDPNMVEDYTYKRIERFESWGLEFLSTYTWEKPVALYWQHTFNTGVSYSLYHENRTVKNYNMDTLSTYDEVSIESPNFRMYAGYDIGYYPNTRTHIRLHVHTVLEQYWGNEQFNDNPVLDKIRTEIQNMLTLDCYYYISPQLRFNLMINGLYRYNHRNEEEQDGYEDQYTDNNLQTSISAGFVYKIF